jgi:hypothetical protein
MMAAIINTTFFSRIGLAIDQVVAVIDDRHDSKIRTAVFPPRFRAERNNITRLIVAHGDEAFFHQYFPLQSCPLDEPLNDPLPPEDDPPEDELENEDEDEDESPEDEPDTDDLEAVEEPLKPPGLPR